MSIITYDITYTEEEDNVKLASVRVPDMPFSIAYYAEQTEDMEGFKLIAERKIKSKLAQLNAPSSETKRNSQ